MKPNRFLSAAALLLAASASWALVQPMAIGFQGKLINPATNAPATGTAQLTFKIFNVASGGAALWTEGPDGVVVTNGVFSLTIGTNTALTRDLFLGASAYLEVTVNSVNGVADGTAMTPRQPLAMSPFAFSANQLSDQNDVRLIAGPTYSTFTSAGNLLVPDGITASSATITGGLTASSGTFLATGVSQFSVATSSGINVAGGGGVYATFFAGSGAALTGVVSTAGTSTGVVTTAALTGNGNSPTPVSVVSSSVAVLNPSGYVQNFQLDPASVTKQGLVTMASISSAGGGASITISTSMAFVSTVTVLGPAFSVGGSSFSVAGGSSTVGYQLSAKSLSATGADPSAFGLTVSSGLQINGGTVDMNGGGGIDNTYGLRTGTLTVTDSNFSVGGSSFSVSGGSATAGYQLAAKALSATATDPSVFGLSVSSGLQINAGTLSMTGGGGLLNTYGLRTGTLTVTDSNFSVGGSSFTVGGGSATLAYGLTASSLTLTTTGSNLFYGLTVSSGAQINGGTLDINGGGGVTNSYGIITGTLTVTDAKFTVGGSSFVVNGGSATIAYSLTAGNFDWALVSSGTLTAATANLSVSVPGTLLTQMKVQVTWPAALSVATRKPEIQFNGDTAANYSSQVSVSGAATVTATTAVAIILDNTNNSNAGYYELQGSVVGTQAKMFSFAGVRSNLAVGTAPAYYSGAGYWSNVASPITSVNLLLNGAGNFPIGTTIRVFGMQ